MCGPDGRRGQAGVPGLADAFRSLHPDADEYSWVGRTCDGYRYDHAFCSRELASFVASCQYEHQPRSDKLSDHSALTLRLAITAPDALPVGDPASEEEEGTLF